MPPPSTTPVSPETADVPGVDPKSPTSGSFFRRKSSALKASISSRRESNKAGGEERDAFRNLVAIKRGNRPESSSGSGSEGLVQGGVSSPTSNGRGATPQVPSSSSSSSAAVAKVGTVLIGGGYNSEKDDSEVEREEREMEERMWKLKEMREREANIFNKKKDGLGGGSGSSSSSDTGNNKWGVGNDETGWGSFGVLGEEDKEIVGAVKDDWPMYSCRPVDYALHDPIGFGSSSIVYKSTFKPLWERNGGRGGWCAVKVIDVDKMPGMHGWEGVDRLRRETQLMSLSKHPNILRVRGEWMDGSKLYIATRMMNKGSMLDIMRYAYPDGFDETVIATVLKQAVEGIKYLHQNGWLHRDIKAGNLLVDDDGTVLLADFGVSSSLLVEPDDSHNKTHSKKKKQQQQQLGTDDGTTGMDVAGGGQGLLPNENGKKGEEEMRKPLGRKSFVGTPCWMAPEVVQRERYDSKADIWSFGITALELTLGRAPLAYYPPAKVLMKTLNEAPPTLDREREGGAYKYSKQMKEMVEMCLQKDPKKRPTAEKLLQHPFFKQAKKRPYLISAILADLPPLELRQAQRKRKNSATMSHTRYTSWDFSLTTTPGSPKSLRDDPFANFTSVAEGASPAPSVRKLLDHSTATATKRQSSLEPHHSDETSSNLRKSSNLKHSRESSVASNNRRRHNTSGGTTSNSASRFSTLSHRGDDASHTKTTVSFDFGDGQDEPLTIQHPILEPVVSEDQTTEMPTSNPTTLAEIAAQAGNDSSERLNHNTHEPGGSSFSTDPDPDPSRAPSTCESSTTTDSQSHSQSNSAASGSERDSGFATDLSALTSSMSSSPSSALSSTSPVNPLAATAFPPSNTNRPQEGWSEQRINSAGVEATPVARITSHGSLAGNGATSFPVNPIASSGGEGEKRDGKRASKSGKLLSKLGVGKK